MRRSLPVATLAALVAGCERPLPCARYEGQPGQVEACGAIFAPMTDRVDDADCALAALHGSPSADMVEQVALCHAHAGKNTEVCVGHSEQRFAQVESGP